MTVACPVCVGTEFETYLEGGEARLTPELFGSSRSKIAPGRILRCRTCRFGFQQTRAHAGELAEVYRRMDTAVYQAELRGRAKTAARHLRIVERDARRKGRLLDVGCASGLFLRRALDAGWEVAGVEPNERLYEEARAVLDGRVHNGTLERVNLPPASFDAVALWDVLEHVPDPAAFLRACAALLKPGGHLFLNVPDLDSLEARLLGNRWPLLLPEHLNYFNRSSLKLCGDQAGLQPVRFGRRRVFFSVDYICYRLAQHGIPGARLAQRVAHALGGRLLIPVPLGEIYGVWRR